MRRPLSFLWTASLALLLAACAKPNREIDLSGAWTVALDSLDRGIAQNWQDSAFDAPITLPGTLCDAGYGTPCTLQPAMTKEVFLDLKRKYDYVGSAWYRREVDIPADWAGRTVRLSLERVLWQSQVWVNGKAAGQVQESLSTPHGFDLTDLVVPGQKNVIVLRIDNRRQHIVSESDMAHAYTNATQTMWNGVLGRMVLQTKPATYIDELRLTPDVDASRVNVSVRLEGEVPADATLEVQVKTPAGKQLDKLRVPVTGSTVQLDYALPDAALWDEFNPNLYEATACLQYDGETDEAVSTFGMRKLTNHDALLQVNGHRIFLRGTLECCIFPLKGYPPTDEAGWKKVFDTARAYGLNHLRFHSWCPPEAAFRVADRMGFYLQIELPSWALTIGQDRPTVDFFYAEAARIMHAYGNHPSFCFWSLGNELQGDFGILEDLLTTLKQEDSRHLYTMTTFTFEPGHGDWPEPADDFWVSQWTRKGWVRGQGVFDDRPVGFDKDFSASIDSLPVPIIAHEIGQYSVFPNLKERVKYTGNLLPLNFEAVAQDLERKGRTAWAEENLLASGRLAVILYKEEIERALKTSGFSGFQLLGLQDFPGQGTALVGLLDAFWESKGLISPEEFRRFCAPVVPLARFAKATYTTDETFTATLEVANFGGGTLQGVTPVWQLADRQGNVVAQGAFKPQGIALGNVRLTGTVSVPLAGIGRAGALTFSAGLKELQLENSWDVYVYPAWTPEEPVAADVLYTRSFTEAGAALEQGRKVLLNPASEELNGLEGKFVQVFWSPVHFPNQAGTMGIHCDPAHPALAHFPTDAHSNWQWWDLCKHARTLVLDSLDAKPDPIVRMTDNFYKNRNLALVFEAQVGQGRLLMCSSDLFTDLDKRPVARQMRYSLLQYMASDAFRPQTVLSFGQIERAFHNKDRKQPVRSSIYD